MTSLFPIIQPQVSEKSGELPLYREVAWDYKNNVPVWRGGVLQIITGAEAIASWAYRALQVARFRYEIYSWDYGNECNNLIGTVFTDDLKRSEAKRYVKECLLVNPYITGVNNITVEFDSNKLTISCDINTVYGEVNINV